MKRSKMIAMKVYMPESTAGKESLAWRVSGIHSEFVNRRIHQLTCGNQQKQHLLDAVITEAKKQAYAQKNTNCNKEGTYSEQEDRENPKDM